MIILVGMSCAGKTTTGKTLSKIFNYEFYDTDIELEKKMNLKVPIIYEKLGEKRFREEEFSILQKLENECCKNTIIATGGGIVENSAAVKFLSCRQNVFLVDTDIELEKKNEFESSYNLCKTW